MNSPLQAAARRASIQRELNRLASLQDRIQRASVTLAMWLFIVGVTTAAIAGCAGYWDAPAVQHTEWCGDLPPVYGSDC